MRLLLCALLTLAIPAAYSQASQPQRVEPAANLQGALPGITPPQSGCPIVLASATAAPEAHYLPVAQAGSTPSLDLRFRNASGKAISSVAVTAELRVKTSVYALDATTLDIPLTFSVTQIVNRDRDQLAQLRLPQNVLIFAVTRIGLTQVTFADGSVWTAPQHNSCVLNQGGEPESIDGALLIQPR